MSANGTEHEPNPTERPVEELDFDTALDVLRRFNSSRLTSASPTAAPPPYEKTAEAIYELTTRLEKYDQAEENENTAREIVKRESVNNDPPRSLSNFAYNVRIEVDPSTLDQELRIFHVSGEVTSRTYGEDLIMTHSSQISVPRQAKLDYLAFDNLVEAVADSFWQLIETASSEKSLVAALKALEVSKKTF